jgi:hypothetical protein
MSPHAIWLGVIWLSQHSHNLAISVGTMTFVAENVTKEFFDFLQSVDSSSRQDAHLIKVAQAFVVSVLRTHIAMIFLGRFAFARPMMSRARSR